MVVLASTAALRPGWHRRVVALLAIGQADRGGDLGAGQVLEEFEVLLGLRRVAGALQRARQHEFGRRMQRLNGERLLEDFNLLCRTASSSP